VRIRFQEAPNLHFNDLEREIDLLLSVF
jgi:hypothetical protein